jgi:iron complex transport system substrate-binding protein
VAARASRLTALIAASCVASLYGSPRLQAPSPAPARAPQRIISLVPALTETLFAIGAGPQVVGVSSYDQFPPQVRTLPRVGALLDPDTERILALRPDFVITYGSQLNAEAQFARAGIRTYSYRHGGIATVLESLGDLAMLTGHRAEGEKVARDLQARFDAVRARVRGRPRPRTMIVFEHDPGTLRSMFVSGGIGFLHDMLDIAGGEDVFGDVKRESVQPSMETLISRAPDVIVEIRGNPPSNLEAERRAWLTLTTVPAVKNGRVHFLAGEYLVVPGPRVAQGVEAFARTLHPEAFR